MIMLNILLAPRDDIDAVVDLVVPILRRLPIIRVCELEIGTAGTSPAMPLNERGSNLGSSR
jgi:hypothetical protein